MDGKDQKRQESLRACPKFLRVPCIYFTDTVLSWRQPMGLLSLRTEMASIAQKLLFPPFLPSETQPRLVRVYWNHNKRKIPDVWHRLGSICPLSKMEWVTLGQSVPHGQPQGLGPCCPQPQLWACPLGVLIPGPRVASVHPHWLEVSC